MAKEIFNEKALKKGLDDDALLDLVQRQTLRYFWDFAHPASGMARERSHAFATDPCGYDVDVTVTTGGSGFGIMAIIAGVKRGWIDRQEALDHIAKMVGFLETADRYHGVFPHFLDGNTGKTVPFSRQDNGGDLVETSFLMMGLLTARQFFGDDAELCARINALWEAVEWDWHTKDNSGELYWHWSPDHEWALNLPIKGWNECLITHVLAAASPTHAVSPDVYKNAWQGGKDFKNGDSYDGIDLPLGPEKGGPLFFAHYSFLGLNPAQLQDEHADYFEQNRNHALINRAHCIENPHGFTGYGEDCWGLTACDSPAGYDVHSPTNDLGVIAPTAALSSFPYTPEESMKALRHFYEEMGDKIWGDFGFVDAFDESKEWQAKSNLAIDQGPIVVMIENHRSGLLWDLFMSCPEVKTALQNLDFKPPPPKAPAFKLR